MREDFIGAEKALADKAREIEGLSGYKAECARLMKEMEHVKSERESVSRENERLKTKLSGRAEQIVEQQREERWQRIVESLALATEHAEKVQDENDRLRGLIGELEARVSFRQSRE